MPGSSLWLVPPADHPLNKILTDLICTHLPARFPDVTGPQFAPHMTLTSNISPETYGDDAQQWLDCIPWPAGETVRVRLRAVKTEDTFYRRGYIEVDFEGVREVAGIAKARGVSGENTIGPVTEEWLEEWKSAFGPHVSLIYGEVPIEDSTLGEIEQCVKGHGVKFDLLEADLTHELAGWNGGVVWLVPTDRSIEEWKPIATKRI